MSGPSLKGLLVAFVLGLPALPLGAQEGTPAPAPAEPTPSTVTAPAPLGPEAIVPQPPGVRVIQAVSLDSGRPNVAGLGDALVVSVRGIATTLQAASPAYTCSDLILYLNDMPILGSPPESCSIDDAGTTVQVRYFLDRTDASDRAWHALLEEPIGFYRQIPVSVGATERLSFPTDVKRFELEVIPKPELAGYCVGLVLFLVLGVRLVRRTTLLRDRTPAPEGKMAPYSLSRFQLAFWSFMVIAAYLFIWLITEELDTITGSVLTLLGIGAGTALGATVIDAGKPEQRATAPPRASQGFLKDVLSDAEGLSLYRFQLFSWTLVLGVIFCASVYKGLQMPQFSTTLLGLMGLSSGTYLGFKVPESQKDTQPNTEPPAS